MNPDDRQAERRARIVLEALSWLGTPYRHQASVKGQGADCLGLVRGVYGAVVGEDVEAMPPYPRRPSGRAETLRDAADRYLLARQAPRPGDVLLFRMRRSLPISHCGILIAEDRFIHAYEGQSVIGTALSRFWRERLAQTYSFPERS